MSLNCKLSGFNGRLSTCSKLKEAKEPLHGPISVRKWRRRLLFFCLLVFGSLGSIGFLLSFNHGTLWGKDKAPNRCKEKLKSWYNIFNVSKNQLHALTSPLSESDQRCRSFTSSIHGLYTVMIQGTNAQFDENIYRMLSLSIVDDNHVTFCLAI